MKKSKRQIVLHKGREKFIYLYDSGEEEMILEAIKEQWKDPEISIDDLDVILLTFKLRESLVAWSEEFFNEYLEAN